VSGGSATGRRPGLPPTARSLPISLLRAREKVMGPIRAMLADAGVTEQQWRVLRALDENGAMSLTDIARLTCIQLPSLTRIVQTLVDKGLVLRVRDTEDRRRQTISLTEAGAAVIRDNAEASRRITTGIATKLGHHRHRELLELLDTLNALDLSLDSEN
jgi:homoprotocatechuate degradation regulator HpaR